MSRLLLRTGVLVILSGYLSGCATQDVADPNKISLEHALYDTEVALIGAHEEAKKYGTYFGLYACSVTAVFNISATAGEDNKLALSVAPPVKILPIDATGSASFKSTASGTRGNTVTVNLANPACSSSKATGGTPSVAVMAPAPKPGQKPPPAPQPVPAPQPQPTPNPYGPVLSPQPHP